MVTVLREAKNLGSGEIIELITTFLPAPGIDTMRSKGYSVWTTKGVGNAYALLGSFCLTTLRVVAKLHGYTLAKCRSLKVAL